MFTYDHVLPTSLHQQIYNKKIKKYSYLKPNLLG